MNNFIYGFLLSGSMIIAIGAQNVFILRNGLAKNNIALISAICFICDILLITFGIFFVGSIAELSRSLTIVISTLAVLFLFFYGLFALRKAIKGNYELNYDLNQKVKKSKKIIILQTLSITLLNPHVYLDTVIVVGGVSASLSLNEKTYFLFGALTSSFLWFFGLGYFSRYLAKFFQTKIAWIIFDIFIALFMWFLAISMIVFISKTINN